MPSVVFSDGTQRLQIGMHFDDGKMFVLFYKCKEQVRGEPIIGNVNFLSRKYNDQVQIVRELVDKFLQSIYYDPAVGRFITIDDLSYLDPENINGLNLYAYCGNNPVMCVDPDGKSWSSFWKGVGNWFKDNWVKLVVGAAFILAGAVVTFFTAGMGTAGLLAAGGALLASAKAVGISMAVSAGVGAIVGGITGGWEGALQGFSNGLADGFMWGGIFAGGAQILSGAMKITRNISSGFNGFKMGKMKIWSPNSATNPNIGGTLLKFGKFNRIDTEVGQLLHIHLRIFGYKLNHLPLGTVLAGIIGGLWRKK